jgi:hypothetical protein
VQDLSAAQNLGLKLVSTSMRDLVFDNFERLRALVGPLAGATPACPWAGGAYKNREVICASSAEGGASTRMTHVFVRLDPALMLGLRIVKLGGGELFGPRSPVAIPYAGFSNGFYVTGWEGARIRALLQPQGRQPEVLQKLLQLLSQNMAAIGVTDNLVRLSVHGTTAPQFLAYMLDSAVWIADALVHERAALPFPRDLPDWSAIGERLGLAYDPARVTLTGNVGPVPVLCRMFSEMGAPYAEAVARLPQELRLGLALRASAEEGIVCLPPHLADQPPVRDVMARVRGITSRGRVSITDGHVSSQLSAQAAWDVPTFAWLVDETIAIAGAVGRASADVGPYR